jgi:quercetin dioxygenase-like cupin family protein
MKIFPLTGAAPVATAATSFTGSVRSRRLTAPEGPEAVHLYRVEFARSARTHWHTHSGPQWLFVVDGRIRLQKWGEPAEDLDTGDAVVIEPGEKHWHGAAPGASGTHLAFNIAAATEWLEPVSDEQYDQREGVTDDRSRS